MGSRRWWAAGAVAGFVLLTLALPLATPLDVGLRDLADANRPAAAAAVAGWANRLGSGGILTTVAGLLALGLALRRRSPWPVAPVAAAFVVTGAALVPLKLLLDRAAPHAVPLAAPLFSGGESYPSGHAVNAIVWYGVITGLLQWGRSLRWVVAVVVTAAGVYLGYHWFTDMLAGLCLGVALDAPLQTIMRFVAPHRADHDANLMIGAKGAGEEGGLDAEDFEAGVEERR